MVLNASVYVGFLIVFHNIVFSSIVIFPCDP